ncbi:hypothetical protein HUN41_00091 [Streptomyces phage Coruscant]|uniref:Uncharacterized protein n=1 Tax=Streptomyces phage Coruscant TaxID=2739834 RepID=A0A7G4AW30_9CAUD|nr:hypothetical protein PP454_gp197 [Streptomyces phage Coruscant]QMP84220.1 hypothetical protein HUN41_00091 [Streptomyces phage Coruscant]
MICAYSECGNQFEAKTHNQKFCSPTCCRKATNARIMQKYYARRARRQGIVRRCIECPTILSRYNSSDKCELCHGKKRRQERMELLEMIGNAI